MESIKSLISIERKKVHDLFEDEKIIRKGGNHPSLKLAALIEKEMHAIKPNRESRPSGLS